MCKLTLRSCRKLPQIPNSLFEMSRHMHSTHQPTSQIHISGPYLVLIFFPCYNIKVQILSSHCSFTLWHVRHASGPIIPLISHGVRQVSCSIFDPPSLRFRRVIGTLAQAVHFCVDLQWSLCKNSFCLNIKGNDSTHIKLKEKSTISKWNLY